MQALGFVECLAGYEMKLIPTYKNAKNGKIIHQLDHVYATANLYKAMSKAYVIDDSNVFENSLSDHLPIVADYMMR